MIGREGRVDLDSHSDSCIAGPTFKVLKYTGEVCDVHPFSDSYNPITGIHVVQATTAYDHPSGVTYILVLSQALYFGGKKLEVMFIVV